MQVRTTFRAVRIVNVRIRCRVIAVVDEKHPTARHQPVAHERPGCTEAGPGTYESQQEKNTTS
jgi:hypothetical protein